MVNDTAILGEKVLEYGKYKVGDTVLHETHISYKEGKIDYIVVTPSGKAYFGIGVYGNIPHDWLIRKIEYCGDNI